MPRRNPATLPRMTSARTRASRSGRIPAEHKRALFIAHYLIHVNATQAAIAAGYSKKTAKQAGSELLSHPDVKTALAVKVERQLTRVEATAEKVLEKLAYIGLGNPIAVIACRTVADLEALPVAAQHMIQSFEVLESNIPGVLDGKTDLVRRVRMADPLKALDILAKHFGLVREVHEHHHRVTLEALVAGSMDDVIDVTPSP